MATTFTESLAVIDEIAERINLARKRRDRGRQEYATAQSELGSLAAQYSAWIAELEAAAAANAWPQAAGQKAEKDQLVADYQALKTNIDSILAAIDAA